mmetsp:Transcript_68885/g.109283  ORF Transcript_68885/g.109283 Transcript_68885/m.109283 type:complete len:142 (-) Transcript_68885:99-524(-)|eukprot:CAMPEP_0169061720 /NCGR_PEP_ID=MMETSP1015-20121227/281_1 /TAXON_ID=342587 /ORGANISM="Karlodinium micrum, Strain CCMP2283" /LENGTH=141 /DNA_ID=CAMNT_0009119767 /DNA_START=81 /DNA_END=506 /DNA_ORIENTATION=-
MQEAESELEKLVCECSALADQKRVRWLRKEIERLENDEADISSPRLRSPERNTPPPQPGSRRHGEEVFSTPSPMKLVGNGAEWSPQASARDLSHLKNRVTPVPKIPSNPVSPPKMQYDIESAESILQELQKFGVLKAGGAV